jgi:hypothetical protein
MRPTSITTFLAEAHRQDLFHEAERAALAAEAESDPVTSGLGTTALLFASDLLLAAGHSLRARLVHPSLALAHTHTRTHTNVHARVHASPSANANANANAHHTLACVAVPACRRIAVVPPRIACLEA